jgi:uncharacterized membrane protein YbhN (UPF0104 family)
VLGVIAVAVALPSAPGYVGPFQAGTVQGLALLGVARETALSLSIVYHLCNYIPITIAGLAYLSALNLTLGELRTAGRQERMTTRRSPSSSPSTTRKTTCARCS